jgi:3-oxoacyl-(acyl-carrier-protein) synthase
MDSVVEHLLAGRLARQAEPIRSSCRPFRQDGSGYALGEGAAFLMLESVEHAQARNARIYGEILSSGEASDPSLLLRSEPGRDEGLRFAAAQALATGGIQPDRVDAVFGDAFALPDDDRREVSAYRAIFDSAAPPFTAATPALGFPGAASGVFSVVHACFAIALRTLPPLANCDAANAPGLPLVDQARPADLRRVLVWNSDRGMKNAAVLVAAYPE